MNLVFDENFSYRLSNALKELEVGHEDGVTVSHLEELCGRGQPDEEWIPKVADKKGIVITQDINIHKTRALNQICESHSLSLILFKTPKKKHYKYWEWVEIVIGKWRNIKEEVRSCRKRFVIEVSERSIKNLSN
jgi:hypothetical protein